MSIERLGAEDRIMLWPDEIWPQDIGALAILDGTNLVDGAGRFRIETVREVVASRLHLVRRFRQLLLVPPRQLGGPLWIDAPAFNILEHVGVVPLPAPGDEAQLLLAVERLRRRPLDRGRPLWEMWFLPGLPARRVALFVRMHHTIADGIAAVASMGVFLDATPDAPHAPAPPWTPEPAATDDELLADGRATRRREAVRTFSQFAHPIATVRRVRSAWPAIREFLAEEPLPPTSLDRVVGPDRGLVLFRSSLDLVKEVADTHRATVNDVLLTVIAGGLRGLLSSRGEAVDGVVLRTYVPVSLRPQEQRPQARGNLISQMVVPLPIGVSDPILRLEQIAAETARRKAKSRPSIGKLPHGRFVGRALLKLVDRQRVNVTSANIPGPRVPLYFAGAPVLEVFPLTQLVGKISLGVAAMSYAGQFNLLAVADRQGYPDLDVFASCVREELAALASSIGIEGVRQVAGARA